MRIAVTGGFGFVGSSVVSELADKGHKTFPLSRRNGFDLTEPETVRKKIGEIVPDVIVNCAAHGGSLHYVSEFAADVVNDNLRMTLTLYKAVCGACPSPLIINPLSNCSYPGESGIQREEEWWNGPVHPSVWSYGNIKRMLGVVSDCYRMQYGIRSMNFLIPNAYGPGDSKDPNRTHALNGMIIRMLQAKKKGDTQFVIWGTGKPVREWIFVRDIARVFAIAVDEKQERTLPVNIAQASGSSIGEIAVIIKRLTGYEGDLVYDTSYQDGAPEKVLDDSRFRELFGDFRFTPLEDGIRETISYYRGVLEG
ncbi:MAG: NAD-dependent epimerase/dehydratase family protein [Spirochaetes bacterium]|nr:NAD-dependent epimerase/dehydratase family protein [Spirochaetota bacterium]